MNKALKDNIVRLFDDKEEELPDVVLDTSGLDVPALPGRAATASIDLTGKPKVLMAIGLGGTGKTTLLRWIIERALERDDGQPLALASVDPINRELVHYFPQVMGPMGQDPARTALWLNKFLLRVMATQKTAAIDFGGGDTSLLGLLRQLPDLQAMMERSGVEPVALHLLSPRVSDLTPLAALDKAGFMPKATALILNLGRLQHDRDPEQEFAQLRKHASYRATLDRGAIEIWMPRLFAAKAVEDRRMGFRVAADGSASGSALNIFDRSRVHHWLRLMEEAAAPIASWLT